MYRYKGLDTRVFSLFRETYVYMYVCGSAQATSTVYVGPIDQEK